MSWRGALGHVVGLRFLPDDFAHTPQALERFAAHRARRG